jgi:hypothetical protein
VATVGRNDPCLCGSGLKTKRCCGVGRGPSEESLARATLSHAATGAAHELRRLSDSEFDDLLDGLPELPALDLSLQVELPKLLSPRLDRFCEAFAAEIRTPPSSSSASCLGRSTRRSSVPGSLAR